MNHFQNSSNYRAETRFLKLQKIEENSALLVSRLLKMPQFFQFGLILLILCVSTSLPKSRTGRGYLGPRPTSTSLPPYIDIPGSPNVSVSVGRTATLKCKTVNLIKKSAKLTSIFDLLVSWLRHKDVNLLSVGTYLYTKDPRMMVSEDLSRGEWELRITEIRHSDAGSYECQINTNPLLSHTIVLTVVEPYTEIFGDSLDNTNNLYIDIRSILNLTCVVYSPEVPAAIFWKHNGKLLDIGGEEDGTIQTIAGKGGSPTRSYLSLALTDIKQSGTYQCSPSNTGSDEVEVHIVQDKELPVGQSESVQLQITNRGTGTFLSSLLVVVFFAFVTGTSSDEDGFL